jgi:hypothetical protein
MAKQYKVRVADSTDYYSASTLTTLREEMLNEMAKDGFELITTVATEKRVIDTFVRDDENFVD